MIKKASVVLWSVLLLQTQRYRVRFPGAARFFVLQSVWNGVHSGLVRINEEILERKVEAVV
jgi:hypothetical protein